MEIPAGGTLHARTYIPYTYACKGHSDTHGIMHGDWITHGMHTHT